MGALGICEYITKPRIAAAITGKTPDGEPIKGDYKFTDEFPMADGFEENVEFFTLTYEAPLRVASNREFAQDRAAAVAARRVAGPAHRRHLRGLGRRRRVRRARRPRPHARTFLKAVAANDDVAIAFIVTDEDRLFESIVARAARPRRAGAALRGVPAQLRDRAGRGSL